MLCSKCGNENINGTKFCIRCGGQLISNNGGSINNLNGISQKIQTQNNQGEYRTQANQIENRQNVQFQQRSVVQPENKIMTYDQTSISQQGNITNKFIQNDTVQRQSVINSNQSSSESLNYVEYIIGSLIKPIKNFKNEENKLENSKVTAILMLFITIFMTVLSLIQTMFSTVREADYSWTGSISYSWEWSNLKEINYLSVIGKNFLIYACIIIAIAAVFYLGSLVIKKQLNFIKLLAISATSVIPAVICSFLLSPILGIIWDYLSIVCVIFGCVYSFIILYELMNYELQLNGDKKLYFNLICLGILMCIGYFSFMNLILGDLGGIFDLL